MPERGRGHVLRGVDGSIYLIRDEILEACKIEGGDLEYARKFEVANTSEGGNISEGPFTAIGRVEDTCATHPDEVCQARPDPPATLMCGW